MSNFLIRLLSLSLLALLGTASLQAQSYRAFVKEGEKAMAKEDYQAALHHFSQAVQKKEADDKLWYNYARSAHALKAYGLAEEYYQKALNEVGSLVYPEANFHLGQLYKVQGKYGEAKLSFNRFLQQKTVPEKLKSLAYTEIKNTDWANGQVIDSSFQVKRLGKRFNTPYSEFGAFPWKDTLFYSSYRYPKLDDQVEPPRKISKILYRRREGRPRTYGRNLNIDTVLTAHATIQPDGKRLYFTRCRYVNGSKIRCQIYYRDRGRRGRWSRKERALPAPVNLANFSQTQPTLGYDSTRNQMILFFSSDRTGGEGGLDLWMVDVPKSGSKWEKPSPINDINTAQDEITPFFHQASQTLYFSSNGYQNLGSYDVFSTKKKDSIHWLAPKNMGSPINSSYDDVYYALDQKSEKAYVSSNRPGSLYLVEGFEACCYDLYQIEKIPEEVPEIPDEPEIVDIPELPPVPSEIDIPEPRVLEEFLPLALYFDNDEPDKRTRRTSTKKTYGETYESYWDRKEDYLTNYSDKEAIDDFFRSEVKANYDKLNRFSAMLLRQLKKGEQIEIFLKGYTSPRAQGDYNLRLGKRRVSSLQNHFQSYKNGAFERFLKNGQLVITEVSFGETQAAEDVSDDLTDEAASIYSPGAARERRVEIVEIEREEN